MKGMKHFGNKGKEAAMNEMKQLHERNVFEPVRIEELNNNERKRAMENLIFLVEKRDGTVKGRVCANGSVQRPYIDKDDATSPMHGQHILSQISSKNFHVNAWCIVYMYSLEKNII